MNNKIEITTTRTGHIFADKERQLEFLSVGDYGPVNNIKAEFLGLKKEIKGVNHKEVDLRDKWVITISTQKGCPMKCKFCDCPVYGYYGNANANDLAHQILTAIQHEQMLNPDLKYTKRLNLHYARMGEPTFNNEVLSFTRRNLKRLVTGQIWADTIHPVVSTMMPKNNPHLKEFLHEWCDIKNDIYGGEAGLQLSINTTDENTRNDHFNGCSCPISVISSIANELPTPRGRKYTLNFAVTKNTVINAVELNKLFDKSKFIAKITPIHQTSTAIRNGFEITSEYTDFDVYRKFEQPLLEEGWDVIVFVPSKEEDEDRITCGNALLAVPNAN